MNEINRFVMDMSAYFGSEDPKAVLLCILAAFIFIILMAFSLRSGRYRKNALYQITSIRKRVEALEDSLQSFEGDLDAKLSEFRLLIEDLRKGIKTIDSTVNVPETPVVVRAPAEEQKEEIPEKKNLVPISSSLKAGLKKTREGFFSRIKSFFSERSTIDEAALSELEEVLLLSDIGVQCSTRILDRIKDSLRQKGGMGKEELYSELKDELIRVMTPLTHESESPLRPGTTSEPRVLLIVGVNGVGKTTSAAKLAKRSKENGANPILVAADTFRAAAVEQLIMWGERLGIPVVSGKPDDKPSTVIFDAIEKAGTLGSDVIIIDTAGRLHTKSNLMQELEGIKNVFKKKLPNAPDETLLVVDGVTGNNALNQAREFNSITPLTGVVVTKLDGTPKGGIVVAIRDELKLPVRFIGVGEQAGDLMSFDAKAFVESLVTGEGEAEGMAA